MIRFILFQSRKLWMKKFRRFDLRFSLMFLEDCILIGWLMSVMTSHLVSLSGWVRRLGWRSLRSLQTARRGGTRAARSRDSCSWKDPITNCSFLLSSSEKRKICLPVLCCASLSSQFCPIIFFQKRSRPEGCALTEKPQNASQSGKREKERERDRVVQVFCVFCVQCEHVQLCKSCCFAAVFVVGHSCTEVCWWTRAWDWPVLLGVVERGPVCVGWEMVRVWVWCVWYVTVVVGRPPSTRVSACMVVNTSGSAPPPAPPSSDTSLHTLGGRLLRLEARLLGLLPWLLPVHTQYSHQISNPEQEVKRCCCL